MIDYNNFNEMQDSSRFYFGSDGNFITCTKYDRSHCVDYIWYAHPTDLWMWITSDGLPVPSSLVLGVKSAYDAYQLHLQRVREL